VEFSAPSDDGGASISTYQYSTDAGATWRTRGSGTTGSPLRITTLSNDGVTPLVGGQTYPVEVRAVNAAGPGAASAVADGITTTVPGRAHDRGRRGGRRIGSRTFDPPSNGGAEIIRYDYRLDGARGPTAAASRWLLDGLSIAGTYEIEVRAVNSVGAGDAPSPATISVRATPVLLCGRRRHCRRRCPDRGLHPG
jgi:titin